MRACLLCYFMIFRAKKMDIRKILLPIFLCVYGVDFKRSSNRDLSDDLCRQNLP